MGFLKGWWVIKFPSSGGGKAISLPQRGKGKAISLPPGGWGKKVIEVELMRVGGYGKMKNFRVGGGAKRALALP